MCTCLNYAAKLAKSDTTTGFADYLEKYYIGRKKEWAICFHK